MLSWFQIAEEVKQAIESRQPVVALETTVITHGLPYPENLELAQQMEREVRSAGAIPATIGLIKGVICVGLKGEQLELLAKTKGLYKISARDIGPGVAKMWSGGTTVAGTLVAAHIAGIRVFATGGIGGVHRGTTYDISADLLQLAHMPLVVVCAGAKAILDLSATLETLEMYSVPVIGYQTEEFPAFYCRSSHLPVGVRVDTPQEAADLALAHWQAGLRSAVLVAQPPPDEAALPDELVEDVIQAALHDCKEAGIHGQKVTPYLLRKVNELTHGMSLKANLALLLNNARLAAKIAQFIGRSTD